MNKYNSKLVRRYSIFLFIIIAMFLLNISVSLASDSLDSETLSSKHFYTVSRTSENSITKEYNRFYTSIINNKEFERYEIMLNGHATDMIDLTDDSEAIRLPDERIGLRYSQEDSSLLPQGSYITYYYDDPVITIPNQSAVLKVSKVVVLPIENFTSTASFDQSIEKLDNYKVKIFFNELDNPEMSDNIVNYSVDWGDGSADVNNVEEITTSHIYKKSGTYELTINVTDDFGFTYSIRQRYEVNYEGHLMHTYFWVKENKEPVAVTTTTSVSALAVGLVAFTETGKYKFLALLPLLIPMYTRIQKEDVLDQFVRGQVYGYIKTHPGVHYNQIRRGIGIKNGTLSYHLSVLEKTELIKSRREGIRYRAFYPTGMKFPEVERFRLTELQISILEIIKENIGINQKEIANKLKKKPQTINYNIKVLEQAGLIEVRKHGRRTGCFPKEDSKFLDTAAG